MNIIKWLKMEWYIPHRNKAESKTLGHRQLAKWLEEKTKKNRREQANMEYHYCMAEIWNEKLEHLEFKIQQIKRKNTNYENNKHKS